MSGLVAYCRPGFESDCAAELQEKAAVLGSFGYCQTKAQQGYVIYRCAAEEAEHLAKKLALSELIFSRQFIAILAEIDDLPSEDRVTPLQLALLDEQVTENFAGIKPAGDLRVETPDTNVGKELTKFCRKFTVPLRQGLRKAGWMTPQVSDRRPTLHAFFISNQHVILGFSFSFNQSPWLMGIPRLRMPSDAPSRSTLKLDEAFQVFIPAHEREERVQSGMNAVDLGAAPGGWTYQLVHRGMMVQAVDNGPMAESLMDTGQVKHIREDGFRYRPKKKNVTWLVCDMVEKPSRVGELMTSWILEGDCKEAIFNLKLPMKRRYAAVAEYLAQMKETLSTEGRGRFELQAKQLYHDREEITVHLRWL
ncbi:23S rRNA (cytidine(2498)-2'-O)-methyltransferase RlmM [Pseudidiomarina salilacus]|uniref:23S rRNA (cytidine(2498)-2'-O)-methyltransferase RlmM n=1 Tax=Pseudidiomarina salilacus TaxID=3384452 RepID=UPI003984807A